MSEVNMPSANKFEAVDIKAGKLTNPAANEPLAFDESRIDSKHFTKISVKCKDEKSMLAALKIEDKRAAKK
jgi:hypothetical protein